VGEFARQIIARRRHKRLGIEMSQTGRNGHGSHLPTAATAVREPEALAECDELFNTSEPKPASPTKNASKKTVAPAIEIGPTYDPGPYLYVKEASALAKVLPALLSAPAIGLDTETTGLDPLADTLRTVQLATEHQIVVVDTFHCPATLLPQSSGPVVGSSAIT
jgi:hypothetical protein